MQRHWPQLTQFLKLENCPLDNNFVERALRRAVILRKNSLFFKTTRGSAIGDLFLSIIETCAINGINPFDYMVTLVKNKKDVRAHPELWLPWNFDKQKNGAGQSVTTAYANPQPFSQKLDRRYTTKPSAL
jgi:hypothetical protein